MRGQQYIQLPYSLLQSDDFTIAMIAKRTSYATDKILFTTGSSDEYLSLNIGASGNSVLKAVKDGKVEEISGPEIESGATAHVALTVKNGEAAIYIDGKIGGTTGLKGKIPSNRLLTYIGRGQNLAASYFTGSVSDLRVYNYALDASEIAALAAGGSGVGEIAGAVVEVAGVEYYTTQGVRISDPLERGVTIVRTVYSDGTVRIEKIIR